MLLTHCFRLGGVLSRLAEAVGWVSVHSRESVNTAGIESPFVWGLKILPAPRSWGTQGNTFPLLTSLSHGYTHCTVQQSFFKGTLYFLCQKLMVIRKQSMHQQRIELHIFAFVLRSTSAEIQTEQLIIFQWHLELFPALIFHLVSMQFPHQWHFRMQPLFNGISAMEQYNWRFFLP